MANGRAEAEFDRANPIKTLQHIACEDRRLGESGRWKGEIALVSIKGDIDDLGTIFQQGLARPTFAKMASLSRQVEFLLCAVAAVVLCKRTR